MLLHLVHLRFQLLMTTVGFLDVEGVDTESMARVPRVSQ